MSPVKPYLSHLFSSLVILALLVTPLFLFRGFLEIIIENPLKFIDTSLSQGEIYFAGFYIAGIIITVLMSWVIYLLLAHKTRFDMKIWNATKELALSKEQFRKLYDGAPVPYILLNKKAEIFEPNKAALRFFGVLPEEIKEKNIFSYVIGPEEGLADKLALYHKNGKPINRAEVTMMTKSGETRWVQLSIFKMDNPGDLTTTGLAMIFDITEEKELDKAKTEFVSLASHQLRTPLVTAKWITEILSTGDMSRLSQKQKDYIGRLHSSNEEMIDLVDTLLNVSRIEIGSLKIDPQPTNAEELAESVLDELSLLIEQKKIKISKNYGGFLQNIQSDPKLLRIVIQNLVSNAVKYTPEGGSIFITFKDGADKKIVVSDTGYGIPESQIDKIFTKLFRADNIRMIEGSQGTGLGLYLVKSVIESMGGSISFTSQENKGSTFTITL